MTTQTVHHPETGEALYRYVLGAAKTMADNEYADGSNKYPGGRGTELVRTAKGRWVWVRHSLWQGDPSEEYVAATDVDGTPFDAAEVESFLGRFGDEEAMAQWRSDINNPLPLA